MDGKSELILVKLIINNIYKKETVGIFFYKLSLVYYLMIINMEREGFIKIPNFSNTLH